MKPLIRLTFAFLMAILTVRAESPTSRATPLPDAARGRKIAGTKWGMFVCWSFITFSGKEWTREPHKPDQPDIKKSRLEELLTRHGPIESIWFDHAQGTGGLSHDDTDGWVREFQPDCFSGFTEPHL